MPTVFFYLLALIPLVAGGVVWVWCREITWGEWLGNAAVCFAMAGLFHFLAMHGRTSDLETWSGQLTSGRHLAAWQEYYEEAIYRTEWYTATESYTYYSGTSKMRQSHTGYRTVQKSRRVFDHWEPRTRWHPDSYEVTSNLETQHVVDRKFWANLATNFGGQQATAGTRHTGEHNSRMIGGDPDDYTTHNKTGYVQPVTKLVSFENKLKAAPSTFSFAPVPPTVKVFPYPTNHDPFRSDRLVGTANLLDWLAFDQLNARLGPRKKVNLILVGFGDRDVSAAEYQRAAWVGGKKNDVVICWGGLNKNPTWVRAFGWTDAKICLANLETIGLEGGFTEETLPRLEAEIAANYRLKDWEKAFAHISVPAPAWAAWVYLTVMLVGQVGFWWWARGNELTKAPATGGRAWAR